MSLTVECCGEDVDREEHTCCEVHNGEDPEEEAGYRGGSGGAVTVD